nr:probable serine/threonine-protein kinase PIX13 isoform X1 [Tanacetum cinerariifolium]
MTLMMLLSLERAGLGMLQRKYDFLAKIDVEIKRTSLAYLACTTTNVYSRQVIGTFGPALHFTSNEQQHRLAGWAKHCIREVRISSDSKILRQSNENKKKDIMMEKQATTLAEIGCHSGVDKVIGEGGFGKVYKGWLDSVTYNPQGADDKLALAVKISNPDSA